jgi:DNA-binding MarR family transcriptional regulator
MRKTASPDVLRDTRALLETVRELGKKRSLRDPISLALEEMRFTPAQVHCLLWLGSDGELTMGEIASRLGITEKTITGVVDRLENDGQVRRVRSEDDRRIVRVHLTAKGAAIYRRFDASLQKKIALVLSTLSAAERRALLGIIKKISERLPALIEKGVSPL